MEFIQSIHWESFWIGVVVTVVFGIVGAVVLNIIGEL